MKQYLLKSEPSGGTIEAAGKDFHYLVHVRRLKPGDTLQGLSPAGRGYLLTVDTIRPDSCVLSASEIPICRGAVPEITLFQALPKGSKMDMIIRMSVEGGAVRIIPVETHNSIVKLSGKNISVKLERWRRIAREAAQQSGISAVPRVEAPIRITNIPEPGINDIGLFFHQELLENSSLHGYLSKRFESIALVVGPEGGFTQEETVHLEKAGYRPVFLGERILRTETAAVYSLGAVQTIILERKTWIPAE